MVEDCRFVLDEEWDPRCNEMLWSAQQRKPCLDYKGYYAALALEVTAKPEEIARAYKERIGRWEPKKWAKASNDQRTSAELQFQALSQVGNRTLFGEQGVRLEPGKRRGRRGRRGRREEEGRREGRGKMRKKQQR